MNGHAIPSRRELLVHGDRQIDVLIDGAGPAIVLLPSSQRDSLDFDPLVDRLAATGFKVLRPQPPGMGRSTPPAPGLDLHALADEVRCVIDRHGDGRAIVAGHAYGHYTARVTDLDHRSRVRGVVVMAGAAQVLPPGLSESLDLASDAGQAREARLAALRQAFFAPGNPPDDWLEGWYPQWRETYRRAATKPPRKAWWPRSHAPVLDLQAADDPWRPASTRGELRAVLGEQVCVQLIAEASHALPVEQPAAVAEAIVAWARRLPP